MRFLLVTLSEGKINSDSRAKTSIEKIIERVSFIKKVISCLPTFYSSNSEICFFNHLTISSVLKNERFLDAIDCVIISGNSIFSPWKPQLKALCEFAKVLLVKRKPCLFMGLGWNILHYLLSLGLEKPLPDILQKEDDYGTGVLISEKNKNSLWLEVANGNLYSLSKEENCLKQFGNAGLHLRIPKFQISTAEHSLNKKNLFSDFHVQCKVRNRYLGHKVFDGMENSFLIPFRCKWVPVEIHRAMSILAECKESPLVIELDDIHFAFQFESSQFYPESERLVKNAIEILVMKTYSNPKNDNHSFLEPSLLVSKENVRAKLPVVKSAQDSKINALKLKISELNKSEISPNIQRPFSVNKIKETNSNAKDSNNSQGIASNFNERFIRKRSLSTQDKFLFDRRKPFQLIERCEVTSSNSVPQLSFTVPH